ncbi:MAG: hypothetical protein LQ343_003791 [Gyalolechia ehrenbergii]|nr:MAG: hypothetical protein LQ343_003791 [Gyalolechia ehrenbergii]
MPEREAFRLIPQRVGARHCHGSRFSFFLAQQHPSASSNIHSTRRIGCQKDDKFWTGTQRTLKRQRCDACIVFVESGSYDLRPSDLTEVIALTLRNSIYVSSTLLGDPYEVSQKERVAFVVGNVGNTGIVMMVAPVAPRINPADVDSCSHRKDFHPPQRLTALDTWEEILDLPEDLRKEHFGVVRAQKNWLARLPAACIVIQMNVWAVIQPNEPVRWAFCCPQHFPWAAVEADNSVMAGSPTPASGRAVESAGSQVLKDSLAIIDESGYASDDTVRTVEHYEPAKDGRDAVLQLFIY